VNGCSVDDGWVVEFDTMEEAPEWIEVHIRPVHIDSLLNDQPTR